MKVMGKSTSSPTGYITKKLARIEPQSTLRSEVILASDCMPPISNRKLSPSCKFKVLAIPSSMLMALASCACQRPATTSLRCGSSVLYDTLNSRSTRRLARSSVKSSGDVARPLTATSRPRIMGYQSNLATPASVNRCRNACAWSGMMLITKRFGASGGVACRQLLIRSVRSSTSSTNASSPTASELTCTTV